MSVGSRQTRRRRRARGRRARTRELMGVALKATAEVMSTELMATARVVSAGLRATAGVWKVLGAVELLVLLAGAVAALFSNEYVLVILFCLLAVLLYGALVFLEGGRLPFTRMRQGK